MHFEVDQPKGEELITQLREELPGYAVFKYVKEIPNKRSKTPLIQAILHSIHRFDPKNGKPRFKNLLSQMTKC